MPLEDLLDRPAATVITDEDRIMHTTKMVERSFGVPAEQLGTVELRDGQAVLVFSYQGSSHTLAWKRQPSGQIAWFLDSGDKPLNLGEPARALNRLRELLPAG